MNTLTKENIIGISALLVHAAKIDENYTEKEKEIIKKAIIELSKENEKIDEIKIKCQSSHYGFFAHQFTTITN